MANDNVANKVKVLAKYNYEARDLINGPEEFESAIEMDIFVLMINQLKPSLKPEPKLFNDNIVVIEAKWLGNINYNRLKKAAESFASRKFRFNDQKKQRFIFSSPFTDVMYDKGKIVIIINPLYMPYFIDLSLSGYGGYLLEEILSLSSFRCKKLFRIFSVHLNMNKNVWRTDIEECMALLSSKSYGRRKTFFIENVIIPRVERINKTTSIDVMFIYDKRTWAMEFHIKPKGYIENEVVPLPMDEKQQRAYDKLITWTVAPKYAMKIATELSTEFWKWNHRNVEFINNGTIKNPGALILTHFGLIKKADK